jgi:hypothetical protein
MPIDAAHAFARRDVDPAERQPNSEIRSNINTRENSRRRQNLLSKLFGKTPVTSSIGGL